MFAGKKSAQIREILISESAWEEMTCLFAPSLIVTAFSLCKFPQLNLSFSKTYPLFFFHSGGDAFPVLFAIASIFCQSLLSGMFRTISGLPVIFS
ncbi:hypothetical protein DN464_22975 [Enterobacter cloacae]|nr:hypothetical protein DN464_22975 [Enterobacter cloacae]